MAKQTIQQLEDTITALRARIERINEELREVRTADLDVEDWPDSKEIRANDLIHYQADNLMDAEMMEVFANAIERSKGRFRPLIAHIEAYRP